MKSLIKPLMVAVLVAALYFLLVSFVTPHLLVFLIPESWDGSWIFWANPWLAGFIAGLAVVGLLPAQRYHVVPMLILVFAVIVIGVYALNRCNAGQLTAINQLSEQTWRNIGNPDTPLPTKTPVDLTNAPGVTRDGDGFSYSCVTPGETVDFFLALQMSSSASVLGLIMALLLTHRIRRTPVSRQG